MCGPYTAPIIYSGILLFIAGANAASTTNDSDDDPGQVVQDLISDLGPLLALFGERFASQFMSEAISWVDCMVFALAPLGIITMIVAAVRVGGPSWLKTLIGRARETFAVAEMDTMSSTSHEVCECWNGKSIVRVMGQPRMLELLFFEQEYKKEEEKIAAEKQTTEKEKLGEPTPRKFGLHTIDEALQHQLGRTLKPGATRPPMVPRYLSEKSIYQNTGSGSRPNEAKQSATACSIGRLGRSKNTNSNEASKIEQGHGHLGIGPGTATDSAKHPQRRHSTLVNDETSRYRAQNVISLSTSPGKGPSRTFTAFEPANHPPRRHSTFVNDKTPQPRAPNMSLNISPDRQRMDLERNFAAFLGFAFQFLFLAFTALLAYHEPWRGEGFLGASRKSKAYAFPLTAAGTMAVSYGLYLCTRVVERASLETSWSYKPSDDDAANSSFDAKFRCMWLQGQGTVNDQTFDSHVVICRGTRAAIFTSQRSRRLLSSVDISDDQKALQFSSTSTLDGRISYMNEKKHHTNTGLLTAIGVELKKQLEVQAVIGSFVTIFGFISQFIGIRGSHYLVAILNLVATVAMTGVRAYLRRSLNIHPFSQKISPQYELDWFALNFVNDPYRIWPEAIQSNSPGPVELPREEKQKHMGRDADGATTNELSGTRSRREKLRRRFSGAMLAPTAKPPPNLLHTQDSTSRNSAPAAQSTGPAPMLAQNPAEIQTPFLEMRSVIVHSVAASSKSINGDEGKAQQIVQVRQRLRSLAPEWDTPATKYAQSVTKAIQESMHRLLPQDFKADEHTWDIPCKWKGKESAITITSTRARPAHWEVDPHLIEAVLSLWMFQVETQSSEIGEVGKLSGEESDWYHKDTHIRVLSKHSEGLLAALQWWVEKDGISRVANRALEQSRLDSGFMPGRDISKSRVVGVVNSTAKKYRPFGDQASPSSTRKIAKNGKPKSSTSYLVAPTNIPTIQLMAQHIFTAFMWSIVPHIRPIQADLSRQRAGEQVPQKPEVRSHFLDNLIDTISRSTDLGTAEDLYLCIIPALSLGKKLSEAECVIHHAHLRATAEYNSQTEWTKSGKIYTDLFSTARRFGPQSQIGIQATVVLADFFTFLAMKLEQTELAELDAKCIKDIQKSISEELQWADKDVFLELMAINNKLKIRSTDLALKKIEEKTEKTMAQDKGSNGSFGRNEYHIAARDNRLEDMISELKKSSVNGPASTSELLALLDQKDDFNRTPLHYYILFGRKHPSSKNGDSTTPDEPQKPALSEVTQRTPHDPVKTLKWFCKEGAKLQSADNNKCTALHYAVTSYASEAPVRALFELMANQGLKDVKDRYGRTPLHHSAERGSLGITELLLSFGADKTCVNNFGMLPLHAVALRRETSGPEGTELPRILDLLKVDHRWISGTDRFGRTPLVLALQSGQSWAVNHLLTDVDTLDASSDNKGWGPLHHAAWHGTEPALVQKMRASFQNINPLPPTLELSYKSRDGRTPGHIAVVRNRTTLISHLFDRATLLLRDAELNSAIDLAITQDNVRVIEALEAFDKTMRTENQQDRAEFVVGTAPTTCADTPPQSLLEIKDPSGRLPIDLAAQVGNLKALECLIKLGGNPNGSHRDTAAHSPDKEPDCCAENSSCGETPLHYAARSGNATAIKLLRTHGAAIEAKDERGGTPLFRAAYQEHAACIDVLLEDLENQPTANPNSIDLSGTPPLLLSFGYSNNIDATRALLRSPKTDVNARDSIGRTVLYLAVRESRADLVDALLGSKMSGVELKCELGSEETVLDLAMREGNKEIADKIIAYTKGDNMDNQFLPQQLLRMVIYRQVERVRELIEMKAELADQVNPQGENALHIAVKSEDVEIVRLLLGLKDIAKLIEQVSKNNETALHRACSNTGNTILEALLEKKAPLTPQNSNGETVLHLAVSSGDLRRVQILLEHAQGLEKSKFLEVKNTAHHSALWTALSEYNLPIARALMASGADPSTTNRYGLTIWHKHSKRGQSTILQFMKLLSDEDRKKVNEAGAGQYHGTPLQTAVLAGEEEFVRKFCRSGADLDIKDAHGWSPRLCIRFSEDPDILNLVEKSGGTISGAGATFDHLKDNPSKWSTACKPDFIELKDAGLTVKSRNENSAYHSRDPAGSPIGFGVQANCPFAPSGPRYFEIKVIVNGFEEWLTLGVCNGLEELEGMVGWRGTSWGYHGDIGMVFHDAGYGMQHLQYPTFGKGDTVGCGLDKRNRIFFTVNGTKVGTPFESVIGQLFPVIRMSHGFTISTNFGDNFEYTLTDEDISTPADLEEILQEKQTARSQQLKEDRRAEDGTNDSSISVHSIHQSDGGPIVSDTSPPDTPMEADDPQNSR